MGIGTLIAAAVALVIATAAFSLTFIQFMTQHRPFIGSVDVKISRRMTGRRDLDYKLQNFGPIPAYNVVTTADIHETLGHLNSDRSYTINPGQDRLFVTVGIADSIPESSTYVIHTWGTYQSAFTLILFGRRLIGFYEFSDRVYLRLSSD